MDWVLSGITLLGNFLVGRKIKEGWLVFTVASILWICYSLFILHPPQYGLVPAAVVNLIIGITSFRKWYKEDKNEHTVL